MQTIQFLIFAYFSDDILRNLLDIDITEILTVSGLCDLVAERKSKSNQRREQAWDRDERP